MFIGGGRDNVLTGNTCGEVVDTCVHMDNRGQNWESYACNCSSGTCAKRPSNSTPPLVLSRNTAVQLAKTGSGQTYKEGIN
eukprot:COSAG06_NODE_4062_length_4613_cov_1.644661_4_plen_81_part_00